MFRVAFAFSPDEIITMMWVEMCDKPVEGGRQHLGHTATAGHSQHHADLRTSKPLSTGAVVRNVPLGFPQRPQKLYQNPPISHHRRIWHRTSDLAPWIMQLPSGDRLHRTARGVGIERGRRDLANTYQRGILRVLVRCVNLPFVNSTNSRARGNHIS